jgi:hypothetical protein
MFPTAVICMAYHQIETDSESLQKQYLKKIEEDTKTENDESIDPEHINLDQAILNFVNKNFGNFQFIKFNFLLKISALGQDEQQFAYRKYEDLLNSKEYSTVASKMAQEFKRASLSLKPRTGHLGAQIYECTATRGNIPVFNSVMKCSNKNIVKNVLGFVYACYVCPLIAEKLITESGGQFDGSQLESEVVASESEKSGKKVDSFIEDGDIEAGQQEENVSKGNMLESLKMMEERERKQSEKMADLFDLGDQKEETKKSVLNEEHGSVVSGFSNQNNSTVPCTLSHVTSDQLTAHSFKANFLNKHISSQDNSESMISTSSYASHQQDPNWNNQMLQSLSMKRSNQNQDFQNFTKKHGAGLTIRTFNMQANPENQNNQSKDQQEVNISNTLVETLEKSEEDNIVPAMEQEITNINDFTQQLHQSQIQKAINDFFHILQKGENFKIDRTRTRTEGNIIEVKIFPEQWQTFKNLNELYSLKPENFKKTLNTFLAKYNQIEISTSIVGKTKINENSFYRIEHLITSTTRTKNVSIIEVYAYHPNIDKCITYSILECLTILNRPLLHEISRNYTKNLLEKGLRAMNDHKAFSLASSKPSERVPFNTTISTIPNAQTVVNEETLFKEFEARNENMGLIDFQRDRVLKLKNKEMKFLDKSFISKHKDFQILEENFHIQGKIHFILYEKNMGFLKFGNLRNYSDEFLRRVDEKLEMRDVRSFLNLVLAKKHQVNVKVDYDSQLKGVYINIAKSGGTSGKSSNLWIFGDFSRKNEAKDVGALILLRLLSKENFGFMMRKECYLGAHNDMVLSGLDDEETLIQ